MSAPPVVFRRGTATASRLAAHLQACDASFVPPLSERVVIADYAARLTERAVCFEAWGGRTLLGVVAAYASPGTEEAFVSNVSVLPHARGTGLATRLLAEAVEHARRIGARRVRLEVSSGNPAALKLYAGAGFCRSESVAAATPDSLTLLLEL